MAASEHGLRHLFANNRRWAARTIARDPQFFETLSLQQSPKYVWIGCSDSRVPANEIVDLLPGELFVHRNVGNVVVPTDLNCLSVLQYAVAVLKVEHIMVVGHYGCGGVQAAAGTTSFGLIDHWLRHIQDVRDRHAEALAEIADERARLDRLCELNVIEQARHVVQTPIVRDAWRRGQALAVHGWIYRLQDGLLRDLGVTATGCDD